MKRIDLIRHLKQHGCSLKREGAEHSIYWNPNTNQQSSVPRHREIRQTLVNVICKQRGVPAPA